MQEIILKKQLARIMPHCPAKSVEQYAPYLVAAMAEFKINTPARIAAFLAQIAHESNELRQWEEVGGGRKYEGRTVLLGNTEPGDGQRYKGRGPIQLTGRANYRAAGQALGVDLEGHPERAAWADTGFRVAAWYWASRGCNELADKGDFSRITRRINGGLTHLARREAYHRAALAVLGETGRATA